MIKTERPNANELAKEILRLSRDTLLVHLRFLDMALSMFSYVETKQQCIMTDGKHLFYDAHYVLRRYRVEREVTIRDYLHIVLHCVFRHMFAESTIDLTLWDLAADIAVENLITELDLPVTHAHRQDQQQKTIDVIRNEVGMLTAEKIYRYLLDCQMNNAQIDDLQALFYADDHSIWFSHRSADNVSFSTESSDGNGSAKPDGDAGSDSSDQERIDRNGEDGGSGGGSLNQNEADQAEDRNSAGGTAEQTMTSLQKRWQEISERIQVDMETFSRAQGTEAGSMMQNLREVNREKYDYTAFLKKFAVLGEAMQINDDEFDYVFYTYGLRLYKNLPLIEPLEYKEVKRIREFVIAIDTSGSTSGVLVQTFLQKTYNILKSTESFFSKINLHIVQCDAKIQQHVKITSQEEFDQYLATMKILGLGGTDFRPVFTLVDRLITDREFVHLKGLIYFTDGYGTFPSKKPDYETAFVFVDDNYVIPEVPPWAIRLVLTREEV